MGRGKWKVHKGGSGRKKEQQPKGGQNRKKEGRKEGTGIEETGNRLTYRLTATTAASSSFFSLSPALPPVTPPSPVTVSPYPFLPSSFATPKVKSQRRRGL